MMDPSAIPVRFSRLKRFAMSPAHYLDSLREVEAGMDEDEDTACKRMGRLGHRLVLGGQLCVYPGERRGNAWKEFKAEHAGEDIVTAKEHERAVRIAESLARHSDAMHLLRGEHEVEIDWSTLGRACVSHLDVLGDRYVTELKLTACSSPGWFTRQALRMSYHAQLAFYLEAVHATRGPCSAAYVVAVETARPHVVTAFELTRAALEAGHKQCRIWMEQLLACEHAMEWPGYAQRVIDLDLPEAEPDLIFAEDVA